MAYVPSSGSVVAFQSDPTKLVGTVSVVGFDLGNTSIITKPNPASVFVVNPVSVLAVNPNPSSVYVVNPTSLLSVTQGTDPWKINIPSPSIIAYQLAGSILATSATITPAANQSVSGTIHVDNFSSVIAYQAAGSVLAVSGSFSSGNTSVTAFQGGLWITSLVSTIPSSVMVGASIFGTVPVTQVTTPWAITQNSNSIIAIQLANSVMGVRTDNASVIAVLSNSSVAVLQGTNPWQINMPSPSVIAYQLAGSVMATSATVNTGNSSVQLLVGTAAIGSVATLQGTNPWVISNSSVTAYMGGAWSTSIQGTYLEKNAVTASVIGIPALFKIDETNSVLSAVSPQSPFPIRGSVAALQGTNPWTISNPSVLVNNIVTGQSSVYLIPGVGVLGSVATLQGTNPWIINMPSPSVVVIHPGGSVVQVRTDNASVITTPGTATWITSLVSTIPSSVMVGASIFGTVPVTQGTSPWVIGTTTPSYLAIQPGGSVLNATISGSVATFGIQSVVGLVFRNDGVVSILGVDKTFRQMMADSAGRQIIKPFVSEDGTIISFNGSVQSTSVTLIQASTAGLRTYITDFWVANSGSVATIVQFRENTTSVIGTTIAPAGGGSNALGLALPIKTSNANLDLGFVALVATSTVYMTVKGYQAP